MKIGAGNFCTKIRENRRERKSVHQKSQDSTQTIHDALVESGQTA